MRTRNYDEKDVNDALWLPTRENIKKQQNLKEENNRIEEWREAGRQELGKAGKKGMKRENEKKRNFLEW